MITAATWRVFMKNGIIQDSANTATLLARLMSSTTLHVAYSVNLFFLELRPALLGEPSELRTSRSEDMGVNRPRYL